MVMIIKEKVFHACCNENLWLLDMKTRSQNFRIPYFEFEPYYLSAYTFVRQEINETKTLSSVDDVV